jgi:hypothetical protein
MRLKCLCGNHLDNIASPNSVEHLLVSDSAKEKFQNLADDEIRESGEVDMWPEHWENAGSIVVWKCFECGRLYLNAEEDLDKVVVYKIEQHGIDSDSRSPF